MLKAIVISSTATKNGGFCNTVNINTTKKIFGVDTVVPVKALLFTDAALPVNTEDTLSGFSLEHREDSLPILTPTF